jgi:hypothetical protein
MVLTFSFTSAPSVLIRPSFLDFGSSPICMSSVLAVDFVNTHDTEELRIFSTTTNSVHFHPALHPADIPRGASATIVIPPQSNLTIAVAFVPRETGWMEGEMLLQTSRGGFLIHLQGHGLPSPYRVQPLTGAKVLPNHVYSPHISISNPYSDTVVQVREMYTSATWMQLSVPHRDSDLSRLWHIAPHSSQVVMDLYFISPNPGIVSLLSLCLAFPWNLWLWLSVSQCDPQGLFRDSCISS